MAKKAVIWPTIHSMKPKDLYLRCYAYRAKDGLWYGVCLDLCLAVQGDRYSDVKARLHSQIADYVREALTIDSEHAEALLSRKAPLSQFVHYYWIKFNLALAHSRLRLKDGMGKLFTETLPLHPC